MHTAVLLHTPKLQAPIQERQRNASADAHLNCRLNVSQYYFNEYINFSIQLFYGQIISR